MDRVNEILHLLYKPDHESKQAAIAMIEGYIKDSERLDWLAIHPRHMLKEADSGWEIWDMNDGLLLVCRGQHTFRQAVDAAMKGAK